MSRWLAVTSITTMLSVAMYQASNWWERAYAKYDSSELTPDGCIRIDTFEPFWVLPTIFHRMPDPDPAFNYDLGMRWEAPIFKRAYEARTGALLGETVVFEAAGHNLVTWNESRIPGRRIVKANGFPLVDSDRCADEATLGKLEAYRERRRDANRAIQAAWNEERVHEIAPRNSGR